MKKIFFCALLSWSAAVVHADVTLMNNDGAGFVDFGAAYFIGFDDQNLIENTIAVFSDYESMKDAGIWQGDAGNWWQQVTATYKYIEEQQGANKFVKSESDQGDPLFKLVDPLPDGVGGDSARLGAQVAIWTFDEATEFSPEAAYKVYLGTCGRYIDGYGWVSGVIDIDWSTERSGTLMSTVIPEPTSGLLLLLGIAGLALRRRHA